LDESISESEEDHVAMVEEVLPGSYSAVDIRKSPNKSVRHSLTHKSSPMRQPTVNTSRKQKSSTQAKPTLKSTAKKSQPISPRVHQKSKFQFADSVAVNNQERVKSFELGEFSDSSSDTDEDTAAVKRSLFVRPIGQDTLMCLPRLSEYTRLREKTNEDTYKKQIQSKRAQHQDGKRKTNSAVTAEASTKKRKSIHVAEKEMTEESTVTEESTAEEDVTRAVRTERNPKLTKKRSPVAVKQRSVIKKQQKPVSKKAAAGRHGNRSSNRKVIVKESTVTEDSDEQTKSREKTSPPAIKQHSTSKKQKPVAKKTTAGRHGNWSSSSPVSDNNQKSFAVLQNTTNKIIDSIYENDGKDLEEDIANEIGQSPQQVRGRPSISFTEKGEEIRQTRSRMNKVKQDSLCTKERDVIMQNSRKRHLSSEIEDERNHDNDVITNQHKQVKQRRLSQRLSSNEEVSDSLTAKKTEQPKKKKKGGKESQPKVVDVEQQQEKQRKKRPPKLVDTNKNKGRPLDKVVVV